MVQVKHFRPDGLDNRFRANRFRLFRKLVDKVLDDKKTCRILDVGGAVEYWTRFGSGLIGARVEVCVLNLTASPTSFPGLRAIAGDARHMEQFADLSFDIVHSNSVIEHVGRWSDMISMANEVRRLAPRYFVQTPYFWFPIEPRTISPSSLDAAEDPGAIVSS